MKFIISGANKQTGARMTLEFEADSKAQAEKKAESAGMYVHTARAADDSVAPAAAPRKKRGAGWLIFRFFLALILLVFAYYLWRMFTRGG